MPAAELPARAPLPRPDVSVRPGTGVASVARMERRNPGHTPVSPSLAFVVPAQAGTHNHSGSKGYDHRAPSIRHGVWVPACAGTTAARMLPGGTTARVRRLFPAALQLPIHRGDE